MFTNRILKIIALPMTLLMLLVSWKTAVAFQTESQNPNIVVILADDMGYGDVGVLNPDSKIPTPHLDSLAKSGITFSDAHSPSGVCTPTRYGLLTGRYCWRSKMKQGVLGGYSPPLLEKDRATIGTMLQSHGYYTGAFGKWHLGMALPKTDPDANTNRWDGDPGIDFGGVITDSPIHHGFNEYFGVTASLDMAPYVFVRNDRFTMLPAHQQNAVPFPHFIRKGPRAEDFVIDEVLDRITNEAVSFVKKNGPNEKPYFLYMPLTAPHKPTQPHARFKGKTKLGEYGDFIAQVDWSVGQILEAIEQTGENDNTLVIFTSDNGSYMFRYDETDKLDHVDKANIQGYRADRHRSNGLFRGTKADIFEGGHHVPFFVRWPAKLKPGTTCNNPICHVDIFATCAEVVGHQKQPGEAPDSYSLMAMMDGQDIERGAPVIHHSGSGMFAIRDGNWKLILGNGSGGREKPKGKKFAKPYQLYDIANDVGETNNLIESHQQIAERLEKAFHAIHQDQ